MRKQQQKSKNSHMLEEINRLFDRLTTEELKAVVETIKKLQDRD